MDREEMLRRMQQEANIGKSQTVNDGFDMLLSNLQQNQDFF